MFWYQKKKENASVLITNSPILLWLFHLHLVHDFVSFAHTQMCLASLHLIPSQFLLPYGHVLPICLKGRHDENASLLVRCTAAQSRALHMTGSTASLLLISSSNRRSNTACHINNSLKVKFSYLKCVCVGETKKAEYQEQVEAETEVSDINRKLDVLIDFLFHDSKD